MNKIRWFAAMIMAGAWYPSSLQASENTPEGSKQPSWVASQANSAREANNRNRNASNQARNAGRDSIGKGNKNMSNGRHHHHAPQINMGAFQVAQGLLGLLASAQADKLANQDSAIAGKLDAVPNGGPNDSLLSSGTSGVSATNDVSGQSGPTGELSSTGAAPTKENQVDLSNPDTKNALAMIQEQFGYSPTQFVGKLAAGNDPAALFTHAPMNRLTAEEALAAARAANASSMATAGGAAVPPSIASLANTSAITTPPADADPATPAGVGLRDSLRDALARRLASNGGESEDNLDVSPDVKAALAARAAEEAERAKREAAASRTEEYNLFEVVHLKYVEREKAHTIP